MEKFLLEKENLITFPSINKLKKQFKWKPKVNLSLGLKKQLVTMQMAQNKTKVVILAGGLGTRLSEYTQSIPKPMVKLDRIQL